MNGFRREIQHSPPLRVGERTIVTEAEVWTFQAKQLSVAEHNATGGGTLWTWMRPTALIDQSGGTEQRIPLNDFNWQLEVALIIAGIILPVLLTIFTTWARRSPKPPTQVS